MKAAHCGAARVEQFPTTPAVAIGNKTKSQIKAIFGLARQRGLDDVELHDIVRNVTRLTSIRALSRKQADNVISALGGTPLIGSPREGRSQRRTQQIKKAAGSKSVATKAQLDKMHELATGRGIGADGLARLCLRMNRRDEPITTKECNRVIEALKAMNARDREKGVKHDHLQLV